MRTASRLLYRHGRLISPSQAMVVLAAIGTLVGLFGTIAIIAALLLLEFEPLVAAPLRWH